MTAASDYTEITKLFFEEGIPGFYDLRFFHLIHQEENSPFYLLASLENPNIEFGVINPFAFFQDYEFGLDEFVKTNLRITSESSVIVLNIVSIHHGDQITVNLKAPVVVNLDNCMAKQIILNEDMYQVRHPFFQLKSRVANE